MTTEHDIPLLMCGEMVRATIEDRKTETRRVVKGAALEWLVDAEFDPEFVALRENSMSPYGKPGDRLWVRETFQKIPNDGGTFVYRATDPDWDSTKEWNWRPSIFMPKEACRLFLRVESVRVERLQEITAADCYSEGMNRPSGPMLGSEVTERDNCRTWYRALWDSLNKSRGFGWETNCWVWVVKFSRIAP